MLNRKEHIHFIGIGGAGMFPMAEVLHLNGYKVTGSDANDGDAIQQLRSWGINVQVGHAPVLVKDCDIVVYTSAVTPENPELAYALDVGKVVMKRAVMLGDLMRRSFSIGVAGTHGKTTTTSLVASILNYADKNPTVIVGGIFKGSDKVSGAMVGDGSILVAEADEYDRSFLQMYPSVAVVTNIEADHLDIYKDIDDIKGAFIEYVHRVPFYGEAILCIDDEGVQSIVKKIDKPTVTYGFSDEADFQIVDCKTYRGISCFAVKGRGEILGTVEVPLTGKHNMQNTMAAVVVALDMGISFETVQGGLKAFPGVKRRMDILGVKNGVTVIDDYAHHPTEVTATVDALKASGFTKIKLFFQPHLYSRTAEFKTEFAQALSAGIDEVYVLPIYKAREKERRDISGADIVALMNGAKGTYLDSKDSVVSLATRSVVDGEAIVLMGAGDVWLLGKEILEQL